MLIAMCGLPGAGKSALADDLGRSRCWPVLSVDPVEAALWRAGVHRSQPTGLAAYVVVEAVAEHLLRLRQRVIVDAVNDAPEAREQWRLLAERCQVPLTFVEVVCTDQTLHRSRLESRRRGLEGFREPTWESLDPRRASLVAWTEPRMTLDSVNSRQHNLDLVLRLLAPVPVSGSGA